MAGPKSCRVAFRQIPRLLGQITLPKITKDDPERLFLKTNPPLKTDLIEGQRASLLLVL
jgi:hypothetical protein